MYYSETFLEHEMHKPLWYFAIQIDSIITARRPDVLIVSKKGNLLNCGLCHWVKLKESEKRVKYQDFTREILKNMEHACDR